VEQVEYRLFCHTTQNWRGEPLTSRRTIVDLIASAARTGITVRCQLDRWLNDVESLEELLSMHRASHSMDSRWVALQCL
jgi:Rhodopirellula transposase DDE domain